jgi:transposase
MTTIVDLDTGQVLGIVAGRDSEGVGNWLFARPLEWRLGVQVVAIDPSAVFRKALQMRLPRTAVSVDAFHLAKLGNDVLTGVRQRLTQQTHGRRGRGTDPVRANRRLLLLRAGDALSDRGRARLGPVFSTDDPAGTPQAAWQVKEQLRDLLNTGSLADAAAAKDRLQSLAERAGQPETTRLWRTVCRWWQKIEVLIVTGATTGKVEANNTASSTSNAPDAGHQRPQLQNAYPVAQCRQNSGMNIHRSRPFTTEPRRAHLTPQTTRHRHGL